MQVLDCVRFPAYMTVFPPGDIQMKAVYVKSFTAEHISINSTSV